MLSKIKMFKDPSSQKVSLGYFSSVPFYLKTITENFQQEMEQKALYYFGKYISHFL